MVGVDPRDNMLFVLLVAAVLVKMNQPVSRIYSRRATAGQRHMIEIARGQFGKFGSQSSSGNIGHIHKWTGIGHFAHLIGNGIGHFIRGPVLYWCTRDRPQHPGSDCHQYHRYRRPRRPL